MLRQGSSATIIPLARTRGAQRLGRARNTAGDVGALGVVLATSDNDVGPGPAGAGAVAASNRDVVAIRVDGATAGDSAHGQAGDGNAGGRVAVKVTAVVVLLNEDTVVGDGLEGDVLVGDGLDGAGLAGLALDAETVHGVLDRVVGEGD